MDGIGLMPDIGKRNRPANPEPKRRPGGGKCPAT
jgi:hypothetical protein